MNKSIYFPAIGGTVANGMLQDTKHKNGKSFRFLGENDRIFTYRKTLCTAGHYHKIPIKEKLNLDFDKDIVLGDSGGFQLSTGSIKYSFEIVEKFFNWLENNTNYAMNIDFPPYKKGFAGNVHEEAYDEKKYFADNLEKSISHFKYFSEHASGKTKFMNVLHGRNTKELDAWYEAIKHFDFPGGWGIGSLSTKSSNDIYLVLLTFFYLYEKKEFQRMKESFPSFLHFLGFSRIATMPVVLYLQHKLNERDEKLIITFDSSSPFSCIQFGSYYFSFGSNGIQMFKFLSSTIEDKDKLNLDLPLPCSCPVCKDVKFSDIFHLVNDKGGFKSEFYMYLGLHNMFTLVEHKKKLESIVELGSEKINQEFFSSNIFKLFKMIDQAFLAPSPINYIASSKQEIINLDNEKEVDSSSSKLKNFFGEE